MKKIFLLISTSLFASLLFSQVNGVNMRRSAMWSKNSEGQTVIEVCWENPEHYNDELLWVKEAIEKTWSNVANIEFTGWGKCGPRSSGIRILIRDSRPHCKGLGTEIAGRYAGMELNFTFDNFPCYNSREDCIKFIAVHEFGHALGLAHEHNRPDCLCDEEPQGSNGDWILTPCDPNSVMNYCNPRWNNYGELSHNDKLGIQTIYGIKYSYRQEEGGVGMLTITDELGYLQKWENVYFELNGVPQTLHVDLNNTKDSKVYQFTADGQYSYRILSTTIFSNGIMQYGAGRGMLYLERNKKYKLALIIIGTNPDGTLQLGLQAY